MNEKAARPGNHGEWFEVERSRIWAEWNKKGAYQRFEVFHTVRNDGVPVGKGSILFPALCALVDRLIDEKPA